MVLAYKTTYRWSSSLNWCSWSLGLRKFSESAKKRPWQAPSFLLDNEQGHYSKFTPLPSKWSNTGPVYTGRATSSSNMDYYTEYLDSKALPVPSMLRTEVMTRLTRSIKRRPIQRVLVGTQACNGFHGIRPGDLIETCTRNGLTHFGVVIDYRAANDEVQLMTLKGEKTLNTALHPISMVICDVYPPEVPKTQDSMGSGLQLMWHLQLLVRDSLLLAKEIASTKLPVIHSHFSRPTTLQALDLTVAARIMFSNRDVPLLLRPKHVLAAYFALQFQDLRTCRPSIETGFFSMSQSTHAAVDKIMSNLSQNELDQYVKVLVRAVYDSLDEKWYESLNTIAPLLILLYHYSLVPDAKLANIISTLLARVYPDADSDSWLTAPSSAVNLLEATGLFNSKENYLGSPYGVCSKSASSESSLTDDLEHQILKLFERDGLATPEAIEDDDSESFIYSFKQADDLAISIPENIPSNLSENANGQTTSTLSIYLPDMRQLGSFSSNLMQLVIKRGKSIELPQGYLSLIPHKIRKALSFHQEPKNTSSGGQRQYLRLTIQFNKETGSLIWDKATVDFVRINAQRRIKVLDSRELDDDPFNTSTSNRILAPLRSVYKLMYDIRQSRCHRGAVLDYSLSSAAYAQPLYQIPYTSLHMIQELRVLAGRIFGAFSSHNSIPMLYTMQDFQKDIDMDDYEVLSVQRRVDGTLTESCRAQFDAAYLSKEFVARKPRMHKGLAVNHYVDIGFPMDNALHCMLQSVFYSGYKWADGSFLNHSNPQNSLLERTLGQLDAQCKLLDWFKNSMVRFYKLDQLQKELQNLKGGYYIFRCVIVRGASYPAMAKGYCHELRMVIDIVLLPSTKVRVGNTVVCTEILELNATDGLIVVGL